MVKKRLENAGGHVEVGTVAGDRRTSKQTGDCGIRTLPWRRLRNLPRWFLGLVLLGIGRASRNPQQTCQENSQDERRNTLHESRIR